MSALNSSQTLSLAIFVFSLDIKGNIWSHQFHFQEQIPKATMSCGLYKKQVLSLHIEYLCVILDDMK